MSNRGYIGSVSSKSTPVVLQTNTVTSNTNNRQRIEGENSNIKPIVTIAGNTNTTTRATYIGAINASVYFETIITAVSSQTNPSSIRYRLQGNNSTVKPVVLDNFIQGIPKKRSYIGSMDSANTTVLKNRVTFADISNNKIRAILKGENSTIKPELVAVPALTPTNKRLYFGEMWTSTPLTTTVEQTLQTVLNVSDTHARLTGENSTIKPLITDNMTTEGPIDRRIYIGGDFFSGNLSGGFIEWDSTTLTALALKDCRRFWGVNTNTSISGSEMQSLANNAKVYSNTHEIIYNTTGGYLYYAHPQPLGTPIIYVNGFMNTAWLTSTVLVLENGVYVNYTIYRSLYKQNGNNIALKINLVL